jgi:hypothetical protein
MMQEKEERNKKIRKKKWRKEGDNEQKKKFRKEQIFLGAYLIKHLDNFNFLFFL